jgi:hypothetical protein
MFTSSSQSAIETADQAVATLGRVDLHELLRVSTWAVAGVLGALRHRFDQTAEEREAFDRLCSATLAWLRWQIEGLRFTKGH